MFLFITTAFPCEVTLYKTNFTSKNPTNFVSETNCAPSIQERINKELTNKSGPIDTRTLRPFLPKEVVVRPHFINNYKIDELLTEYHDFSSEFRVTDIRFIHHDQNAVQFHEDCQYQLECPQCNVGNGKNQFKIKCSNLNFWGSFYIQKKKNVYVLNQDTAPFTSLDKSFVKTKYKWILSNVNNLYTGSPDHLRFYKSNQFLKEGSALKINSLSPINIIQVNQLVDVVVNNSYFKVSTQGIAMRNGKYGDYITIKNMKTNKKFNAKIIDYQTVEVKL